jgi:hypothetical protein
MNSSEWMRNYHYSVKLYQKTNPTKPNFIAFNRGTEAGVYLRYIVDHYHQFPDIAVFVHADPSSHNEHWFDAVRCIRPNATYFNINFAFVSRDTDYWEFMGDGSELWVEQCWREVLKVAWRLENNTEEFHRRVPFDRPISINFTCCQQFFLSRAYVHRRSLQDWKKLLVMIGEQDACKKGEPDYDHLYTYHKYVNKSKEDSIPRKKLKIGPEPPTVITGPPWERSIVSKAGTATQGGAMEHLAHVVFGHQPLHIPLEPTMQDICDQFFPIDQCDSPVYNKHTPVHGATSQKNLRYKEDFRPEKVVSPCIPNLL